MNTISVNDRHKCKKNQKMRIRDTGQVVYWQGINVHNTEKSNVSVTPVDARHVGEFFSVLTEDLEEVK